MDYSYRTIFMVLCFLKLAVFITIYLIYYSKEKTYMTIVYEDSSHLKLAPNPEITELPDTCHLPHINPWNKEIMKFVDLDYHLDTSRNTIIQTFLQNGSISVRTPPYGYAVCYGRCIFRKTETTVSYGPWRKVNENRFDCDMVHVTCKFYFLFIFPYNYDSVHSQIVPIKRKVETPKEKKHSIYVILVDSTAHGQSYRNLLKTLYFMEKRFGAISFPYSSKVAPNSCPNGIPLLLGKSITSIGNSPPDLDDQKVCNESMDSFRTVFDELREAGYRTLYSEDYPNTFYTVGCKGFERDVFDHSITPLIQEISIHNQKLQVEYEVYDLQRNQKPARILQLLDYFGSFIDSYKNEPKFGWIWTMDLGHDKQSTSIALDTMLYKLLVEHQDELEDSYIFLMGDHGLRFGEELQTAAAQLDTKNPMLTVSIPKSLRNSGVMKDVRTNADNLVTHYDTRATWLDIAKFQKTVINSTFMKIPGEKGVSYLRKQEKNRTCQNLPIPPVYCICDYDKKDLPTNSTEAAIIGKKVIAEVNNHIATFERKRHLCGKWVFAEVVSLQGVEPINKTGLYYITVRTGEPYDRAVFYTTVSVKTSGELEVGRLDRIDRYENRGDCSSIPLFCHCI